MFVHHPSRPLRIGVHILFFTCCVLFMDQTAYYLEQDMSVYQYLKTIEYDQDMPQAQATAPSTAPEG